jgi:hypothetical protein
MLSDFILRLTGMPSTGKERLAVALEAAGFRVTPSDGEVRVHAETDLEALVEPGLLKQTHAAAAAADIVIAVDWESTARSVGRIVDFAQTRAARSIEKVAV